MTQYGASIDYTFGATTVTAFAREQEVGTTSNTYMGLGFGYDLGGGAAIKGGIVDPDSPTVDYRADLGVTFSF
jgi:outer membrane protein OmpU